MEITMECSLIKTLWLSKLNEPYSYQRSHLTLHNWSLNVAQGLGKLGNTEAISKLGTEIGDGSEH